MYNVKMNFVLQSRVPDWCYVLCKLDIYVYYKPSITYSVHFNSRYDYKSLTTSLDTTTSTNNLLGNETTSSYSVFYKLLKSIFIKVVISRVYDFIILSFIASCTYT